MSIVPLNEDHYDYLAIPLERYAQIVGVPECAFLGVNQPDVNTNCPDIWLQEDRDRIAQYLWQAQCLMEKHLKYFMSPRWSTDEITKQRGARILLDWNKLIELGARTWALDTAGLIVTKIALDYEWDVTGVVTVGLDEADFIFVDPNDVTRRLSPSAITYDDVTGALTATFPRCRLLIDTDNPIQGWDYTDLNLYLDNVDLYLEGTDAADQITWQCGVCCEQTPETGTGIVRLEKVSSIDLCPLCKCNCDKHVKVNYYSGDQDICPALEIAMVRLAHTLSPTSPCSCQGVKQMWRDDRNIPEEPSDLREKCLFGLMDGAWFAWQTVRQFRVMRGSDW